MPWSVRPSGRYYYRKKRIGRRVISEYVGTGGPAELQAAGDELARQEAEEKRRAFQAEVKAGQELDSLAATAEREAMDLIRAAYLASGYYKHHGQWRRKNGRTKSPGAA